MQTSTVAIQLKLSTSTLEFTLRNLPMQNIVEALEAAASTCQLLSSDGGPEDSATHATVCSNAAKFISLIKVGSSTGSCKYELHRDGLFYAMQQSTSDTTMILVPDSVLQHLVSYRTVVLQLLQ